MDVERNPQQRVTRVIAEQFGVAEDAVTPATQIVADLGGDSLDEIELVIALEDEFDIEIEVDDFRKVRTVADAFGLVERLAAA